MKYLLPLLLLCGCATPAKRVVQTPPLPIMMAAPVRQNEEYLDAPDWPMSLWLSWDNINPTNTLQHMVTDIWSTTDLTQPFEHYLMVAPGRNSVEIKATNASRFFIARFAYTNTNPWTYSDWSTK